MIKLIRLGLIKSQNRRLCSNLLLRPRNYHNIQNYCRFKVKSDLNFSQNCRLLSSDLESDLENLLEFPDFKEYNEGVEDGYVQLKSLLYPNSSDPLIVKLNESNSTEETLQVFHNFQHEFNKESICQLILVLWDQIKIENEVQLDIGVLEKICTKVEENANLMNSEELSTSLLYLNKLGVHIRHKSLQTLIERCTQLIEDLNSDFPISALSRFSVALNSIRGELHAHLIYVTAIPRLIRYIENCDSPEDIRLVSVTLNNMHQIVTKEVLNVYKTKVEEYIENGKLDKHSVKSILKIINFLNFPHWSIQNTFLIRKLMMTLKDNIHLLESRELVVLNRAFQSQLESAQLIPLITKRARDLMEVSPNIELLSSAVLYSLPDQRQKMTQLTEKFIYSFDTNRENAGNELQTLFKILRLLKISDCKLCNTYWEKVMEDIAQNQEKNGENVYQIARYCHRYMHFNNNLGGTYRHKGFERYLTKILIHELQFGLSSLVPSKFAKFSSFVIAYGHEPKSHALPDFIIDKILAMSDQFSVTDCLQLSRGLQILHEMRYRHFIPSDLAAQLVAIENILNNCAKRHTEELNLSLSDINCIIRTYNNRKSSKVTHLFQQLINLYSKTSSFQLSSRSIRDIVFNLNASGYKIDPILNEFYEYILKNSDHISGDTVEKIIYCGYSLGYFPEKDEVFEKCSEIIIRDFDYMNGLSIIQACLSLTYYKALKENLINQVFSIDFIKRLEQEIKMCYSKATYPERVLNQVMQLNRAVCLDYPEWLILDSMGRHGKSLD